MMFSDRLLGLVSQLHAEDQLRRLPLPAREIGAVDDPLEHEADRAADPVMRIRGPDLSVSPAPPQVSSNGDTCEEAQTIQTKHEATANAGVIEAPEIVPKSPDTQGSRDWGYRGADDGATDIFHRELA